MSTSGSVEDAENSKSLAAEPVFPSFLSNVSTRASLAPERSDHAAPGTKRPTRSSGVRLVSMS
jgi:hypothetical protein